MHRLAYDYTSFTKHLIVASIPQECTRLEHTHSEKKCICCLTCTHSYTPTRAHRSEANKPNHHIEFKVHETYLEVFTFQQTDRHTPGYLLFQIEKIKCNKRRATLFPFPFSDRLFFISSCFRARSLPLSLLLSNGVATIRSPARLSALC